jgi:hypothetical protein
MQVDFDTDMDEWDYIDAKDEIVLAFETLGDTLGVEGTNVGWTHTKIAGEIESHMAWGFLGINGEYRLVAELGEDEIIVRRYSHDEPMGAEFKFFKAGA